MRLRLLFTLSLFVAAVAIIWAYTYVNNDIGGREESTWERTIADLKVCSKIKDAKTGIYENFAEAAKSEKRNDAAMLFAALAHSERIHADNCAEAMRRLGGTHKPDPDKEWVSTGTTDENIVRSIEIENKVRDTYGSGMIDRALDNHNRYAARIMTWLAAGDIRHLILLERLHMQHGEQTNKGGYAVCPKCGNIYNSQTTDIYCPFCITKATEFVYFR